MKKVTVYRGTIIREWMDDINLYTNCIEGNTPPTLWPHNINLYMETFRNYLTVEELL